MQPALGRLIRDTLGENYTGAFDSIAHIPFLPIRSRKCLITLCQSQTYPRLGTKVYSRLYTELHEDISYDIGPSGKKGTFSLLHILPPLQEIIESPYISGFLSMLLRNIGYHDLSSVRDTFAEGFAKEVSAAIEYYRPTHLNWNAVLSHEPDVRRQSRIGHMYRYGKDISDYLYHSLCQARHKISGMTLYPDIGSKTLGVQALANLNWTIENLELEVEQTGTLLDLEIVYHKYGIRISGVTEMRWSWKYNVLKPRVYYARGPDVYYDSKYIQSIFNLLIDALPQCNRWSRYDISSLNMTANSRLFIYDYASFTSVLEEIRNFTAAIADFLRGCIVTIIDTYHGPVQVDAGVLVDQFNEACNNRPEFDIGFMTWEKHDGLESSIVTHTCGMLGVPGNISSCTLLHTMHLIMVLEELGCKVVGDDAGGVTLKGPDEILELLQNIGVCNPDKVEAWDEVSEAFKEENPAVDTTWHYTKRPIDRVGDRVYQGFQVIWPPACLVLDLEDQFHTVVQVKGIKDPILKAARFCHSFVAQMSKFPRMPKEWETQIMDRFLDSIRRRMIRHRVTGRIPSQYITPSSVLLGFDSDAWLDEIWDDVFRVPELVDESPQVLDDHGVNYGRMSRALTLAEKLGYATVERCERWIQPSQDPDFFRAMLTRSKFSRPIKYKFYLHYDIPKWLVELIKSKVLLEDVTPDDSLPFQVDSDEVDSDESDSDW